MYRLILSLFMCGLSVQAAHDGQNLIAPNLPRAAAKVLEERKVTH